MAYTKNTWVDQDVERPKTYEVTNNQDGSITLTDSFGLVTELGTPVNAVNMNHIEDGIDGCAIRKHNLTETFNLGEWVLGGTGDDEGIYKSLIANNVGNALTDSNSWEKVKMGGASGRNVGEIITSTLPLTDAGLHLLDGSLLQYGIYKDFIDYIADLYAENPSANYFTTEALWQQSVTTYGSCGKFVYDSVNNTVRLPKVSDILQGTTDVTALGNLIQAGLPNISVTVPVTDWGTTGNAPSPSSSITSGRLVVGSGNGEGRETLESLRAGGNNRSANVSYGAGTVQPQTIKVLYYIVIANSTKTEIQSDIDEIATDLNGKADTDLSNVTDTGYIKMAGAGMPSNKYIDLTLGASGTTYTAPANGWVFFYKSTSITCQSAILVYRNNNLVYVCAGGTDQNGTTGGAFAPLLKGDNFRIGYDHNGNLGMFRFVYAQGSESEAS